MFVQSQIASISGQNWLELTVVVVIHFEFNKLLTAQFILLHLTTDQSIVITKRISRHIKIMGQITSPLTATACASVKTDLEIMARIFFSFNDPYRSIIYCRMITSNTKRFIIIFLNIFSCYQNTNTQLSEESFHVVPNVYVGVYSDGFN